MTEHSPHNGLGDPRSLVQEFGAAGALRFLDSADPATRQIRTEVLSLFDGFMRELALEIEPFFMNQLRRAFHGEAPERVLVRTSPNPALVGAGTLQIRTKGAKGAPVIVNFTYADFREQAGFEAILTHANKARADARVVLVRESDGGFIDIIDWEGLMRAMNQKLFLSVQIDSRAEFQADHRYPRPQKPAPATPGSIILG